MKWEYHDSFDGLVNYISKIPNKYVFDFISTEGTPYGQWGSPNNVLDYSITGTSTNEQWVSPSDKDSSFLLFTFVQFDFYITDYTLRTRTDTDARAFPKYWKVDGSIDKTNWFNIDTKEQRNELTSTGAYATFHCDNASKVRYLKIQMTEKSLYDWYNFHVSRVEFFGKIPQIYTTKYKQNILPEAFLYLFIYA